MAFMVNYKMSWQEISKYLSEILENCIGRIVFERCCYLEVVCFKFFQFHKVVWLNKEGLFVAGGIQS